ncbi:MAG: HAMP domain-containing histidine kinase [Nitrospirae bacterium]|nr:HAMP domain-containing histidine kinase [Nitrospirota bacterium]
MFKYQPSIRQKITLGYYAVVLVIIGLSMFTIAELWYMEKKVQFGEVVSEFFDTTFEIRRFEKNFFLYKQGEDYQENLRYVIKAQEILDQNLSDYRRLAISPQLDKIRKDLKDYKLLMEKFAMTDKQHADQRLSLEKAIRKKGKEIITIAEDVSKTERERLRALLIKTQRIIVFLIISSSLIGIAIGQFLSRMVVRPLKALEDRMKLIAEGRLKTVSINSKDREIISLTNAFNKMLNELDIRQKHLIQREKLASLGTLLSGVAHELNNPLSNISSSCQILMEEPNEGDAEYKKELLSQIDQQTDRARDIVRSLLEFSRHREFKKETLPLKKVFEETILFLRGEIPARIETVLDIPNDIFILADKQRIQQAFLNLIKNALDAIESITDEGKVFIKARKHPVSWGIKEEKCEYPRYRGKCIGECPLEKNTVDIEIEDTGVGIPPEVLPKIFDPFFTTKDFGKGSGLGLYVGKGSGLGLYIVEKIIEEHGGCIGVDSEVGKGTTFLIRLPLKE